MRARRAVRHALAAARENFFPGLLLQGCLLVFLGLYLWNEPTRRLLERVAQIKQEWGYAFALVSYLVAAALLPELLRIIFFQRGRVRRKNVTNFFGATPMWMFLGVTVDVLYRLQATWFGTASDFSTIVTKMAVDQFIYSPFFSAPVVVGWLAWRDAGFRPAALREIFAVDFALDRVFPIVVAGWCLWIPGVSFVYFMPSPLQLPTAVLIQIFWVLIITTLSERRAAPPPGDIPPAVS